MNITSFETQNLQINFSSIPVKILKKLFEKMEDTIFEYKMANASRQIDGKILEKKN